MASIAALAARQAATLTRLSSSPKTSGSSALTLFNAPWPRRRRRSPWSAKG
uniref:Uncharacterized protein n=1 Tax=Fagus sylvatica TaxID=28930 RepID=A0A2N9EMZ6_FAGSY